MLREAKEKKVLFIFSSYQLNIMKKLIALIPLLILSTNVAHAIPTLFNPIPPNGTYIYGRDYEIFSVEISDPFNESSVKLHARVEDPTSIWKSFNMTCYQISSTWRCNSTIPGLEALVHDGNWLLYYFDAYDLEGNYVNLGSSSNPLRVRVDRSSPEILFISPENQSYYSGEIEIRINASDVYSGIDANSVKYSFDNSTWLDTQESNGIFIGIQKLDTREYQNNQSVKIYAKASDKVGNQAHTSIQIFVDNEPPTFSVSGVESNQTIFGVFHLSLNASDRYSGLDFKKITCRVSNYLVEFLCHGTIHEANCVVDLETTWTYDGKHEIVFEVHDVAGNKANFSLPIVVDNLPPRITILSPTQGSIVSGEVNISAEVRDDGTGVKNSKFRVESDGAVVKDWEDMSCETYFCSAFWNSSEVNDGNYLIRVYAEDLLGRESYLTSYVSVSNLKIPQTTTTVGLKEDGKEDIRGKSKVESFIENLASTIFKKFKEKPVLTLGFLLPLVALPFLFFLPKLKLEKSEKGLNVGINFENFFSGLEDVKKLVEELMKISDLIQIKDKIRLLMIKLEKMERDPLKKTVEFMYSSGEEKLATELDVFFKKRENELNFLKSQKEEYFQKIFELLGDALGSEDVEEIKKILGSLDILLRKIKGLVEKEIDLFTQALEEIGKR